MTEVGESDSPLGTCQIKANPKKGTSLSHLRMARPLAFWFFFSFVFNKRGRSKGGGSVSGSRTGLLIFPWFSLYYHSFYKLYRKPLFQALAWQFVMWILKFFSFFKHRESPSSTDFPSVNSQTFFFLKQTMKTIHPKEKAICGKKSEAKTCIPSLLTQ